MRSLFIISIAAVLAASMSRAQIQPPDTLWTRTFNGVEAKEVQLTSDGGYIAVGYTRTNTMGQNDVYLVKTDGEGNEQWAYSYGGAYDDIGYSVKQTSEGGYIVTGSTSSFSNGYYDIFLAKTDSNGTVEWARHYGSIRLDEACSVEQTTDGGFILGGYKWAGQPNSYDILLMKTDRIGNVEWERTFGTLSGAECGYCAIQADDGGYCIIGIYGWNFVLIKTDENGNEEWIRPLCGGQEVVGYSLKATTEGGYIVCGYTNSFGSGRNDLLVTKTDSRGWEEWSRTFGGENDETGSYIQLTSDGGYVAAGYAFDTSNDDVHVYLVKLDSIGNTIWENQYRPGEEGKGFCVQQTEDSGYIVSGWVRIVHSTFLLVRFNSQGTGITDRSQQNRLTFTLHLPYPNPCNCRSTVSFALPAPSEALLAVFDIYGRELARLAEGSFPAGAHRYTFDGTGLGSGIYFVRLQAGDFTQTRKVVLVK